MAFVLYGRQAVAVMTLIEDGQSNCTIVIGDEMTRSEGYTAQELQQLIKEISDMVLDHCQSGL